MKIYGVDLNPVIEEQPELADEIHRMFGNAKPPNVVGVIASDELRRRYKGMTVPSNTERLTMLMDDLMKDGSGISKGLRDVLLDTKPTYVEAPDYG